MAPTGRRYRLIYAVLAFGVVSQPLLQAMTVPAPPDIQQRFDTDQATASLVLTAFLLAASVATPVGGRIGDAFGKTRVFAISLGLLALGSLIAALSTSIWVLIAARAVQGLGGGAVPLSFAVLRDHVGAAVSVTIVTADLLPSGYPTERGYMLGFAFMACTALVAGLGALLIPTHRVLPST